MKVKERHLKVLLVAVIATLKYAKAKRPINDNLENLNYVGIAKGKEN